MVDQAVLNLGLDYKKMELENGERFNLATYEPGLVDKQKVGFIKSFRWMNKIGKTVVAARDYL